MVRCSAAIRAGYQSAARVPLRTAQACRRVLDLCQVAVNIGNRAVMSDAAVTLVLVTASTEKEAVNIAQALVEPMNRRLGNEVGGHVSISNVQVLHSPRCLPSDCLP